MDHLTWPIFNPCIHIGRVGQVFFLALGQVFSGWVRLSIKNHGLYLAMDCYR